MAILIKGFLCAGMLCQSGWFLMADSHFFHPVIFQRLYKQYIIKLHFPTRKKRFEHLPADALHCDAPPAVGGWVCAMHTEHPPHTRVVLFRALHWQVKAMYTGHRIIHSEMLWCMNCLHITSVMNNLVPVFTPAQDASFRHQDAPIATCRYFTTFSRILSLRNVLELVH